MQFLKVTGKVTGRIFMVPLDQIQLIEQAEVGSVIYMKKESTTKYKQVECVENTAEIEKDLGMLQ